MIRLTIDPIGVFYTVLFVLAVLVITVPIVILLRRLGLRSDRPESDE